MPMDDLIYKIENQLNSLSKEEREAILNRLRGGIDDIDKQLVHLLSQRTLHSVLIGRVKRSLNMPTYNPEREKQISKKISGYVEDPLSPEALIRIYERILDESRAIQREELNRGNIFNVSAAKMKSNLKKLLSRREFFVVAGFFFVVLLLLLYTFFTPNYYKGYGPVKFEVSKGEPFSEIVDDLYSKGVVQSKTNLRIAAFIYGAEKKIRAARYYIPNGLSYFGLLDYLLDSKADLLKNATIQAGSSIGWVAEKLKNDVYIDSAAVASLSMNRSFLDSLGIKSPSMLGYILPKTYEIYEHSSPREVLRKFYSAFRGFMTDSLRARAEQMGYSIPQIVTIASIVEGETKKKSEMPKIAGVYYNRLKRGMKLQADPTIKFIKKGNSNRILYKDLNLKSPYNTYKYAGLPPGPINNPGKAALLAALFPDKNGYLYFVADGNGGHNFSSSYKEHQRMVNKYRKWLRAQEKK